MHSFFVHHYIEIPNIAIFLIIALCTCILVYIRYEVESSEKRLNYSAIVIASGYYIFLLLTTVFCRVNFPNPSICLIPYWGTIFSNQGTLSLMLEDVAINILIFVPIGFLLGFIGIKEIFYAFLIGFCLSAIIELSQFIFQKGICETNDIIHNTLGCLFGHILCRAFMKVMGKFNK